MLKIGSKIERILFTILTSLKLTVQRNTNLVEERKDKAVIVHFGLKHNFPFASVHSNKNYSNKSLGWR